MHLFDINVPGGIKFMESETLSSEQDAVQQNSFNDKVITLPSASGNVEMGQIICYDVRFPELAIKYMKDSENRMNFLSVP